jgi:hypothetical protein
MSAQPGLWQQLRQDNHDLAISSNRLGSIGRTFFLFPQGGGPRGAFTTLTNGIFNHLRSRDVIILGGVLREQAVAPLDVYDVSIIGAANQPRQSTSGGAPTGGGACWLAPTSPVATTPLIELRAQGWEFSNIEFTPVNASAAVRLTRSASVDTIDASHARFSGCYFAANGGTTQIGIEDNGGASRVTIDDCRFEGLTGTAILGLNTAAAVPLGWRVRRNLFLRNTNAIAMSSSQGLFESNTINQAADDANNKVNLVSVAAQGDLNRVLYNVFSDLAANVTIAKGYKPGTTDVWRNYVTDVAAYVVTVPA